MFEPVHRGGIDRFVGGGRDQGVSGWNEACDHDAGGKHGRAWEPRLNDRVSESKDNYRRYSQVWTYISIMARIQVSEEMNHPYHTR